MPDENMLTSSYICIACVQAVCYTIKDATILYCVARRVFLAKQHWQDENCSSMSFLMHTRIRLRVDTLNKRLLVFNKMQLNKEAGWATQQRIWQYAIYVCITNQATDVIFKQNDLALVSSYILAAYTTFP